MELAKILENESPAKSSPASEALNPTNAIQNNDGKGENPNTENKWRKLENYLTSKTLSTAVTVYKVGSFTKCVPFKLVSNDSLRVEMFKQKWKILLWHFQCWIVFIMSTFKCINFLYIFPTTEFGGEMAFHLGLVCSCAMFFVFHGSLYMKPRECEFMLNQHDFIFKASPDLGMGSRHWASHPFVMMAILSMSYMEIFVVPAISLIFAMNPNNSAWLFSAFPDEWKGSLVLFGICFALELCWIFWGYTLLVLFFCYWCACIFTVNTALSELSERNELTEVDVEAFLYLSIFSVVFNDFNERLFCPGFNFGITASPIVYIFVALTCYESLPLFIYLCFCVNAMFSVMLILFFLPLSSKVRIQTEGLLEHMKRNRMGQFGNVLGEETQLLSTLDRSAGGPSFNREDYLRKRLDAFRPFGIQISFFGVYTLDTSACMMDQLWNNVLLLLSL